MNQSNRIAAALSIAFVVFITMRGELGTYLGFFFGGGNAAAAPTNNASGQPNITVQPYQQSSQNSTSNGQAAVSGSDILTIAGAFA